MVTAGRADAKLRGQRVGRGVRPSVAMTATGAAIVVYEHDGILRAAVRRSFGSRFRSSRAITSGVADRITQVRADAAGRFVVVYQRARRAGARTTSEVRILTLSPAGRPVAPEENLGHGTAPSRSVQVLNDGRVVALFLRQVGTDRTPTIGGDNPSPGPEWNLLQRAPGASRFQSTKIDVPRDFADGELRASPEGTLAFAGQAVTSAGEAGRAGRPLAAGWFEGAFRPLTGPAVSMPNRNFAPVAVPGREGVVSLLWQQRGRPLTFDRSGAIVAVAVSATGRVGARTLLTRRAAREAQVVALPRGGGLAVWDDAGRWGSAKQNPDGSWRRIRAPRGAPLTAHDALTNRDLSASASGGSAFIWQERSTIRLSVRR